MDTQEKITGTFIMDGMIRGDMPSRDDFASRLKDWVKLAKEVGLHFSLEIDGADFSLLAMTQPEQAEKLQPSVSEKIRELLEQLIKATPDEVRDTFFSTLRSIEYRKGAEVQTLYAITPDGEVQAKQRTQHAQTNESEKPLTSAEKMRVGLAGFAVFLLMILVSAIFIDYRALFTQVKENIVPIQANEFAVDVLAFKNYVGIENVAVESNGRTIAVQLKRSPTYPVTDADFDKLYPSVKDSVSGRLALEALAKGYVRVEFFNEKNELLYQMEDRVTDLRNKEKITLLWPLPKNIKPTRIVVTY